MAQNQPNGNRCQICDCGLEFAPLITPCHCRGSMRYFHYQCLVAQMRRYGDICRFCNTQYIDQRIIRRNESFGRFIRERVTGVLLFTIGIIGCLLTLLYFFIDNDIPFLCRLFLGFVLIVIAVIFLCLFLTFYEDWAIEQRNFIEFLGEDIQQNPVIEENPFAELDIFDEEDDQVIDQMIVDQQNQVIQKQNPFLQYMNNYGYVNPVIDEDNPFQTLIPAEYNPALGVFDLYELPVIEEDNPFKVLLEFDANINAVNVEENPFNEKVFPFAGMDLNN